MTERYLLLFLAVLATLAGCGDDSSPPEQIRFGPEGRTTKLLVPDGYDHQKPTPLLLVIHGYGINGRIQLGLSQLADVDALILTPDSTVNQEGIPFWNATDACCDFYDSGVDDVAYLSGLIEEVRAVYNVDSNRIYLWGHSNGGFMSYRMACERSTEIAAIISLAGATYLNAADCTPSEPVSVLQVHGDADDIVQFAGGADCIGFECLYPGADDTVKHWANYNGCSAERSAGAAIDLDTMLPGSETQVLRHDGCPSGVDTELWRLEGGSHVPSLGDAAGSAFWAWLEAHPKVP